LREFFADHLPKVRGMSPHTVCSYRDSVALLLRFLAGLHDRDVVKLDFDDLSPDSIIAFLAHLEEDRHNTAATRNARLAAIHSFARFAATNHPEHLELCQRVLAVPSNERVLVSSSISRLARSPPSSMRPIAPPPMAVAITRSYSRCSIPVLVFKKFSMCGLLISSWCVRSRCGCVAKVARSGSVLSGRGR
jgi:hypothetical protein